MAMAITAPADAPMACRKRPPISTLMVGASAQIVAPMVWIHIPTSRGFLRPYVSVIGP
jgi:hypothetical protein